MSNYSTPCKIAAVTSVGPSPALRGRRARRPSGDDRQQAILATADRLLQDRLFAEISVDDLARGAGLSRPAFYFYFKSKEAVLLSLLEPVVARADAEFDDAVRQLPQDPKRVWRNSIDAFFTVFSAHRSLSRAATAASATSSEIRAVWLGFMQKWIDRIAAIITAERARGAAPQTIPATDLATSLLQMNERTMMAALATEGPAVDETRVVDTLTHVWVSSIYGEPG